jgi:hypothetical protein
MKIEEGFHCLTGRDSDSETKYRLNIIKDVITDLKQSASDCWVRFGLALHALGDSFAHRQSETTPTTMFSAPYGHLIPGTSTDNINAHRPLYASYGAALLGALLDVGKNLNLKPVLESIVFNSAMSAFSSQPEENLQIDAIRGYSTTFGLPEMRLLNSYAPETAEPDPISWRDFFNRYHSQYKFDPSLIDRLQILATLWAR